MPLIGQKKFKYLNKSIPRVDAFNKVTGKTRFVADINLPEMIYGGMLHSLYPHARVKRIDVSKARKIPGVYAILTYKDVKKPKSWAIFMYVTDVARHVGDVVALVAAESPDILDLALKSIEVEYEELPGVFTVDEAMAEDAPILHEGMKSNKFEPSHFKIRKGDVQKGFTESDLIVERDYETSHVEHVYIEPEAVVADPNPNEGAMTVYATSQNPYFTRRWVADILDVNVNQVRIVQPPVGGAFGGKEEAVGLIAARAALLAKITDRPVKIALSREESILESGKRHPFKLHYKAGVTKDGKLKAMECNIISNLGAYNMHQYMNFRTSVHAAGAYEIPNVKVDVFGVFTNNVVSAAMRGYSAPQTIFAVEQFMEEVAEELGMEPLEFKRKNHLKRGSLTATSQKLTAPVILDEIIETVVKKTDYERKHKQYASQNGPIKKGIGLAICFRGCGLGSEMKDSSGSMVTMTEDGSVLINHGLVDQGQGLKTAYSQIVAETLSIPVSNIHFIGVDTHSLPDGGMTVASRGTVMGSQSLKIAAEQVKEMLKRSAAIMLETDKENVELEDAMFYCKDNPEKRIPLRDVCTMHYWTGQQASVYYWFYPPDTNYDMSIGQGDAFPTYAYTCVVAEVEVDTETGFVDVVKVTSAHDVGTAVNPSLIRGQVNGGVAMGQGFAVLEDFVVEKGRVLTQNYDKYIIPTSIDVPDIDVLIFECDDPAGTYGTKSIGEPSTEAMGGAIANAIYNATGRRVRHLPANIEKVLLGKKLLRGGGK